MRNTLVGALLFVAGCGAVKGAASDAGVDALVCEAPETECDGTCANTMTDREHCGGCEPCELENATADCVGGVCVIASCLSGFCDVNAVGGCEVEPDFQTDPEHCGGCNQPCTGVCSSGVCSQRIFITNGTIAANFGGLNAGDAICQTEAQSNGFTGTWKVWAGDATEGPADRITKKGPYVRAADGVQIADDFDDLADGTLDNPVLKLANGTTPTAGFCWTNVGIGGVAGGAGSCTNWTSISGSGSRNQHNLSGGLAGTGGSQNCDPSISPPARLYCVEQ